ncbi:2099_t:CDS:1 [Ambispora leptoticha]|uniref:2099_t:CDS:1 n=1 Tax=Ambispora leptoticha TaxID=144679 RepID=A0A9N8VES7_9GLOM|nr:2099_t:CDS:1 [Ambispora leptoticha]
MATPIISLLSFSTAYNSFEQDNSNSSTVEQRNPPHLRIRANSISIHDNNSPINSYSSSPPLSMSPSSFTSFLFPPFLTGSITNNGNNNNIVNERERETPVGFNHQRRASESSAGVEGTSPTVHPPHLLSRRYTIASPHLISPSSLTDSNRDEKKPNSPGSTAYRIPAARFWEIGAREDSSVQVAMVRIN